MMKLTNRTIGILLAVTCFTFFAVVFNFSEHGWLSWHQLSRNGKRTMATVTRVQPEIHQSCEFEYVVDSHKYKSSDFGCSSEIGRDIAITYLPSDPSFSTTRDPSGELLGSTIGPLFLSVIAGFAGAWRYSQRWKKRE